MTPQTERAMTPTPRVDSMIDASASAPSRPIDRLPRTSRDVRRGCVVVSKYVSK